MGNDSDLLPPRTTPRERQVAKPATATPKEFGGTGDPDLDEYLNHHVGSAGVTHRNGTFVSGPGKHMTPGQYREKKLSDWKSGDRSTAGQGAMSSMAENFAALKRRQVQRQQVQSPAAPAAPAVPPSPALPAASAVANNTAAAPTSTAPRTVVLRDDGEAAIQKFRRNRAGGAMPTGATDTTGPGMAERGARAIDGPHGGGFSWKPQAMTNADFSRRGSGVYENGKRVMSPAATGPSASVTMPNGKVESTDFKTAPAKVAKRSKTAPAKVAAPVAAASPAPTPAAQPAGDALPINPANAPDHSTIDAALAGVAADVAYRGRNTLLEGMPKPTAAFTGQVEQPARGSEEERAMMERTSLAMRSIPLTPTQKARMPYGALGRPGIDRSKPLNPSALSEPAPKEPEPASLTAR